MIEFYGWASIWAAPKQDEIQEDKDLEQVVKKFTMLLTQFDNSSHPNTTIIFKPQNGIYQLSIMGAANHKSATWQDVLGIYEWLANNASGSFGKLYLQDDEDNLGFNQHFQVYILQNGSLVQAGDEHLKPQLLNF